MKNKEKFAKEILDIACKGNRFMVTKDNKVVDYEDITCEQCLFNIDNECCCSDNDIEQWSESEYVEKNTITSREKKFLDVLLPKWKYIARDSNNSLCIYQSRPIRFGTCWMVKNDYNYYYVLRDMYGSMFDFIKWEDEESWLIEDLKELEVRDE